MQSSNPALAVATREAGQFNFGGAEAAATLNGTATKSIILVLLTMVIGMFSMNYTINSIINTAAIPNGLMYGSLIIAFIIALVTCFKPNLSPFTAPAYAVAEGGALGVLSGIFEFQYPGIVSTAVISTFVVVIAMLALWKFRVIVPTARMRSIIVGATTGVMVLYLIDIVFALFGHNLLPTSGPLSILISLVVCTIAAFNLVLDFEGIQNAVDQGLPKYFEYYNAFSLLVTICWLYIEILKLLAKREE